VWRDSDDALADNGHSKVENERSAAPLELPVRVAAFSDGLYIMRATEINADLLGSRMTAIDGQSVDAVQPCNVILDLRYDDGGDFVNTYGFARDLPKLIPPGGGKDR
jgi:hypothetical protein